MKCIIVLAVLVTIVTCAPADVEVLRYESDNIGVDGYKFAWVIFTIIVRPQDSNLLKP